LQHDTGLPEKGLQVQLLGDECEKLLANANNKINNNMLWNYDFFG
jgi:hypothetical protein